LTLPSWPTLRLAGFDTDRILLRHLLAATKIDRPRASTLYSMDKSDERFERKLSTDDHPEL
jgi:hypothetical protein